MHALLRLEARVRSDSPHGNVHIVETTLDLDLQEEVTRTARSALLEWESEGVPASAGHTAS